MKKHRPGPRIALEVQGPSFRRWFHGSTVVDAQGRPLVVYHGTRSPVDFDVFQFGDQTDDDGEMLIGGSVDPGAHMGPHFTGSAEVASRFACGVAERWDRLRFVGDSGGCGGRVIPVYLAIKNPLVFNSDEEMQAWIHESGRAGAVDAWIDGMIEFEGWTERDGIIRNERGRDLTGLDIFKNFKAANFDGMDGEEADSIAAEYGSAARRRAEELGHDGVRYVNTVEGGGWSWVAFHASQIKSAVGNDGGYDPDQLSLVRNPGQGIVLQRVGGLSPVRQDHEHAPARRGIWASIWPHFDPYLIAGAASDRRAELTRDGVRKFVHRGYLWTRLPVPGASLVVETPNRTWYRVDADALRTWLPSWRSSESERDTRTGVKGVDRRLAPSTMDRSFFEVFIERPTSGTSSSRLSEKQLREGRRASRRGR